MFSFFLGGGWGSGRCGSLLLNWRLHLKFCGNFGQGSGGNSLYHLHTQVYLHSLGQVDVS